MTTSTSSLPRHAISRAAESMREQVGSVVATSVWSMPPAEAGATLLALTRLSSSIAELEARVAAHAASVEVGETAGATSTKDWWAHQTKQTRREAGRKMYLATALPRYDLVRHGLAAR